VAVTHYAAAASGTRRWLVLAVLCVTLLLITVDDTILNVALPSIVRELRATSTQLQWIVDAFAIFFAGLGAPLGTNRGWNRPQ
jgi:MFS family permease